MTDNGIDSSGGQRTTAARGVRWRPAVGVQMLTLLIALFIVAFDNIEFWRHLTDDAAVTLTSNLGFGIAVAVFLITVLSAMMDIFAWRWLYKPFLVVLLLIASVVSYFMVTYGVIVDDTMLASIFQTDRGEAEGLFSAALVWHLLLTGALPIGAVLWPRLVYRPFWRALFARLLFIGAMLVVAVTAVGLFYKDFSLVLRANRDLRMYINPTYAIYSASKYLTRSAEADDIPLQMIGEDASRHATPASRGRRKVMIVVVGETTRAANWGLDGYERQTTPELAKLDVLNFDDAHSCGTSTSVSVPCMFSESTRKNYDEYTARHTENLLDVLERAGISVAWEENQAGGCKGVCARVATRNMRTERIDGVCGPDRCLDGVFLHQFADRIAATQGDVLLVMHTMGSHGPAYYRRYPEGFAVYTPECRSNRPQDCSREELINTYDNTVRYVDHVLASLIDLLGNDANKADVGLIYLSDHGESLGENGLYLHGFPYPVAPSEQTRIPMIVWLSPGFIQDGGLDEACMKRTTDERVGQDNLFATVLGLMDVDSSVYQHGADIFADCRSDSADAASTTRYLGVSGRR